MVAATLVLKRRAAFMGLWLAGVLLVAAGCGGGAPPPADQGAGSAPAPPAPAGGGGGLSWAERVQWGKSIFRANCAACHGEDGRGGSSVALARPDLRDKYPTDEALIARIREGDPTAGMPPCAANLQPEHLQALAAYVRLLSDSVQ